VRENVSNKKWPPWPFFVWENTIKTGSAKLAQTWGQFLAKGVYLFCPEAKEARITQRIGPAETDPS
jgi:hypothetical protein